MRSLLTIPAILTVAFTIGCKGAADPAATKTTDPAIAKKTELSQKLAGMTPDQRARYFQEHAAEIQATYSGVVNHAAATGKP